MKHWLQLNWLSFIAAIKYLIATPFTTILYILVIGLALSLPLGGYTGLANIKTLTNHLPIEPQLTVFMQTDASQQELTELKKRLENDKSIKSVQMTSKEEGLKELIAHADINELVSNITDNPLPDTFTIILNDPDEHSLLQWQQNLNAENSVESVLVDMAWAKRLKALFSITEALVKIMAIVLGLGLIFMTGNSIRMQILTYREEIEISKLIGATDAFIRRPFIYFSLLQGILGGLVSCAIVKTALFYLNPSINKLATLYDSVFIPLTIHFSDIIAVCLISAFICCIGTFFATWRYLSRIF